MARKTHKYIKKKPELAAPAGNLKHLEAVISEGADSVYVGPAGLSGRPPMAEMTMAKIQKARRITKENGRRLYRSEEHTSELQSH